MEPVSIAFFSSDRYAVLLGTALCSLFENKKGDYAVRVFVVDMGISAKNKELLAILEKRYGFTITYATSDPGIFGGIPLGAFPIEVYYRLIPARLLPPACRKIILLDSDVIVRGDIKELFDIDLAGKTIGAVPDEDQDKRQEHMKILLQSIAAPPDSKAETYFNSGMLLIDLDLWRKRGAEEQLLEFIRKDPNRPLPFADQDALNVIFLHDHKQLPVKYNLPAERARDVNERDPLIVHFVGGGKPWYFFSALPYQPEYVYYANKTPWRGKKYKKIMDVYFAKKYHIYPVVWNIWLAYKKIRNLF